MIEVTGIACYWEKVERCYSTVELDKGNQTDNVFTLIEFLSKVSPNIGSLKSIG